MRFPVHRETVSIGKHRVSVTGCVFQVFKMKKCVLFSPFVCVFSERKKIREDLSKIVNDSFGVI